jgi:hypothetical protein
MPAARQSIIVGVYLIIFGLGMSPILPAAVIIIAVAYKLGLCAVMAMAAR